MEAQEATVFLTTESERQQFDVMVRAFEIFRDRSRVRGDLWKDFHVKDAQHHIASKMARITKAEERLQSGDLGRIEYEDEVVDDALDIINYATFIVRHVEKLYP